MKAKKIYTLGLLAALPFGLKAQEYWEGTKTLGSEINRNGAVKMGYARIRSNTQYGATVIEHLPLNGNIYIRSAVSGDDVGDILMNDLGGNVGIGTSTPNHKLTVWGEMASANPNNRNAAVQVGWNNNVARIRIGGSSIGAGNGLDIQRNRDESLMRILNNGNVGIGTTAPNAKLAVNGNIRAKEVKVETANWPDYVFGEDYQLPDLNELSQYIKAHGHLPGMPSAKEVEADGIDLGEMNRKLLEKVEELTLHLLEEKKQREHLEMTVRELISRMDNKDGIF